MKTPIAITLISIIFSISSNGVVLNPSTKSLKENPLMLRVSEAMINKNLVECKQFSVQIQKMLAMKRVKKCEILRVKAKEFILKVKDTFIEHKINKLSLEEAERFDKLLNYETDFEFSRKIRF